MKSAKAIGRKLTFDEVKELADGTVIYIQVKFPSERVFLGTKAGKYIIDGNKEIAWVIDDDFRVLCTAYEWKKREEMNSFERLISNITIFQHARELDSFLKNSYIIADEESSLDSIDKINELMETEISYWN